MMYFDETAKKIINEINPCVEVIDNILRPIINGENSPFFIAFAAYHMGEINGKRAERAKKAGSGLSGTAI